ncbi:monosaccharide ABC transporter membrane protein (CUT2 family) [Halanaerobium saccharolyticum]|uniref:Monosaccharide ABC transporter membrane protein (CUT2 family) n=1 Tax=Halanaerobium saccharolyticum TaxID=43595 RepID=A0A4R7Z881_9FIRM|nr:ABC transporter permease [Halanaerobium saccharolyticum]RAK08182.1 monosaccharide ABC transporter membrane protein (CUT2 family) [Halanaerobium saccharolyticum]TDW04389.1 monosaccharide ABC transporter membrane protein (CUT2 family) [Halanaerobium saccharolyticum]TDX59680.1 monosaccharide ABC transporter membrane protein (CUT2 family) [Halanaerobium saccharolyticum]
MDSKLLNSKTWEKYKTQIALISIAIFVLLLFIITSPAVFLSPQIYRSFLSTVPFVGVMALGLTLILAMGQIDLSFPAVMALSGFVFALTYQLSGSVFLGMLACLLTGSFVGMLNGLLVTKIGIPAIVVTIGMQFFIRGLSNVLSQGSALNMNVGDNIFYRLFAGDLFGIPAQAIWFVFLSILLWAILFRHKFGEHVLFTGDNEDATRMMGINVDKTKIIAFMIMGGAAAFAGILDVFRMRTWWPTMGEGYLMMTVATVFVGGTSMFGGEATILGTFIGAFLIGSLEAGIVAAGLSGFWTRLIYGLLILVAVTIHTVMNR